MKKAIGLAICGVLVAGQAWAGVGDALPKDHLLIIQQAVRAQGFVCSGTPQGYFAGETHRGNMIKLFCGMLKYEVTLTPQSKAIVEPVK